MELKTIRQIVCSDLEFHQLYSAFDSKGVCGFLEQYNVLRRENRRFSLVTSLLESVLPIQRICFEGLYFEEMIGNTGIAQASREILERWNFDVRYEIDGRVARILEEHAFVSYGNHTSGLESIVFDSCFSRSNVYQIGASFLPKIGANITKTALLVHNTSSSMIQSAESLSSYNLRNKVLDAFEAFVWAQSEDAKAHEHNRNIISLAADLVLSGCGVNIFPTGSVKNDAHWKNGIGSLVKKITQRGQNDSQDAYIIPLIFGISETHPIASNLLPRFNITHILAKLQTMVFESTPYIYAPVAIPIEALDLASLETIEITQKLKRIWIDIQLTAQKKFVKWPKK